MRRWLANLIIDLGHRLGGFLGPDGLLTRAGMENFRSGIDDAMRGMQEESQRRQKLGLLDMQRPDRWRSYWYMQQGYLAEPTNQPTGHWQGGPPQHANAVCPFCEKPLLLYWDIDCRDPRFAAESPELFAGLERLPLYHCWRCPEPTVYQVLPGGPIAMLKPEKKSSEESPFENLPAEFRKTAIQLNPLPREIANLLIIAEDFSEQWLSAEEHRRLRTFFGNDPEVQSWTSPDQFGGAPSFMQGRREIRCPNPGCLTHQMGHPLERRNSVLKDLAAIEPDESFGVSDQFAQVAFHLCWKCNTVHAEYRCT